MKIILKIVFGIVAVIIAAFLLLTNLHERLAPFEEHFATTIAAENGDVSVRFMGNTNLLFSDGETNVLIDGWFSRPGVAELALTKIEPDLDAIGSALQKGAVEDVAVIIPIHSHYDHAMDAPEVAMRTGADILGSSSTANIALGWGLDEARIEVAELGRPYPFGKFRVTLIPSEHFAFTLDAMADVALTDIEIKAPLIPPVHAIEYKMGGAFSVLVEHPKGSSLVHGSAGYLDEALNGIDIDTLFLGVAGLASQTEEYRNDYWRNTVEATSPKQIFPVHWDSLTDGLGEKPVMPNLLFAKVLKFEAAKSLDETIHRAEASEIEIDLLPMWKPIVLYQTDEKPKRSTTDKFSN